MTDEPEAKKTPPKTIPTTVRLEPRLMEIAEALQLAGNADSFSDYVRGLIIADAYASGKEKEMEGLLSWVVGKKIAFCSMAASPDAKSEAEELKPRVNTQGGTGGARKTPTRESHKSKTG